MKYIIVISSELFEKGENTNGLGEGKKDSDERRNDEEREIYREDRGGIIKRHDDSRSRRKVRFDSNGSIIVLF